VGEQKDGGGGVVGLAHADLVHPSGVLYYVDCGRDEGMDGADGGCY
jgi:hypothetical protein